MLDIAKATAADFRTTLNQTWTIREGDQSFPLTLTEVRDLGAAYPGASRTPFALTFRGPAALRAEQRIYRLENPTLGEMEIFLVQTGVDAGGSHFEAVFS
jgi:hypothetical protein